MGGPVMSTCWTRNGVWISWGERSPRAVARESVADAVPAERTPDVDPRDNGNTEADPVEDETQDRVPISRRVSYGEAPVRGIQERFHERGEDNVGRALRLGRVAERRHDRIDDERAIFGAPWSDLDVHYRILPSLRRRRWSLRTASRPCQRLTPVSFAALTTSPPFSTPRN